MFYIYAGGQSIYKPLDDQLVLFNPKLTLEIGKAGSLEFNIPPANPFYDRLNQLSTEVSVDLDNEELFHGRVLSNERGFNNVRHIYCEGDLSYLIDSVQKGVQYSGTTHELFNRIIAAHNARMDANKRFTVGTVNIENRNIVLVGHSEGENLNTGDIDYKQIAIDSIVDEWNNSFDYIQTCLIDYCGGYLRTRRVNGTIYIDLLGDFGNRAAQPIELGSNLLDLTEEVTAEDVFTVLIPLGDDNLTIASVNGGSDELVDTTAAARYGRIVKTHVFNNVSSASTLLENARRFMATNVNVPRTVTVRAVDLHFLNPLVSPIRIGDKVTITSAAHDVDDALTCTKIEYDLESPQNNNYTFGNPKQTLTQRYREDIRMSNDTYGNSASPSSVTAASPSAASAKGASAAAAAAATAKKEKDKSLQDFYDAWINVDPDQGHIDLGALYKKYIDGKEVLINQCGIDLDGKTGNVNIQSLHNVVDNHGHLIAENEAYIKMVETDTAVSIQSVTERHDHLANVEAEHYTAITQRADSLGSSINLVARDLNEFEEETRGGFTAINMRADDNEASISQVAAYTQTVDGKTTTNAASIKALADEFESKIVLKADVLDVDTKFTNLTSGITEASALRAQDIKAGSISLWAEGNAGIVATYAHSHSIAATEQSDGTIKFNIGAATSTVPQSTTFRIADTKTYKDGVAAVSIKSLEANSYSSSGDYTVTLEDAYVRYSSEQIVGRIKITLGNNTTKSAVVKMAGKRAYSAGEDSVTVARGSVSNYTFNRYYGTYDIDANITLSNGNSDSVSLGISAGDAINYGKSLAQGYTNINYAITDQQTSKVIGITVVVRGQDSSGNWVQLASGYHEYAK